jgi:hypothetical protein
MPERRSLYWIPDLLTTKNTSTQDKHGFPSLEEDVISWILGKLQEFVCINVSRLEVGCCLLVFTGMSHKKHLMYMLDEWMSVLLMREGKADCTRQLVGDVQFYGEQRAYHIMPVGHYPGRGLACYVRRWNQSFLLAFITEH